MQWGLWGVSSRGFGSSTGCGDTGEVANEREEGRECLLFSTICLCCDCPLASLFCWPSFSSSPLVWQLAPLSLGGLTGRSLPAGYRLLSCFVL